MKSLLFFIFLLAAVPCFSSGGFGEVSCEEQDLPQKYSERKDIIHQTPKYHDLAQVDKSNMGATEEIFEFYGSHAAVFESVVPEKKGSVVLALKEFKKLEKTLNHSITLFNYNKMILLGVEKANPHLLRSAVRNLSLTPLVALTNAYGIAIENTSAQPSLFRAIAVKNGCVAKRYEFLAKWFEKRLIEQLSSLNLERS